MQNVKKLFRFSLLTGLLIVVPPLSAIIVWFKTSWQKRAKIGWVVAAAIWTVFIGTALIFAPPTVTVANLQPSGNASVERDSLQLTGKISPASATVTINDQPIILADDGGYDHVVNLNEGDNDIIIIALDGDKRTEQRYSVHRVTTAELQARADAKAREQQRQADAKTARNKAIQDKQAIDAKLAAESAAKQAAVEAAKVAAKAEADRVASAAAKAAAEAKARATAEAARSKAATATPAPAATNTSNCDPNYSGGCVPNVSYDLNCPDIGFMVRVVGTDKHRFDANKDGYGCESYR